MTEPIDQSVIEESSDRRQRRGRTRGWREASASLLGLDARTTGLESAWDSRLRSKLAATRLDLDHVHTWYDGRESAYPPDARSAEQHLGQAEEALKGGRYQSARRHVYIAERYVFRCKRAVGVEPDSPGSFLDGLTLSGCYPFVRRKPSPPVRSERYEQACAEIRRMLEHYGPELDEATRARVDAILSEADDAAIPPDEWDELFAHALNFRLKRAGAAYERAARLDTATRYAFGLIVLAGVTTVSAVLAPAVLPDLPSFFGAETLNPSLLVYVLLFGVIGASVSGLVLVRDVLSGADADGDVGNLLLPIRITLGAVTAVAVFVLLQSGLVDQVLRIDSATLSSPWILALSFAAGFSERVLMRALGPLVDDEE